MTPRKLNVLVYTGTGTTAESVKQCMYTLTRLLSPNYAVIPITENHILKEPWAPTCALLVFPGGGDLGYCRVLNGEGNRHISNYVRRGGSYLGLCAGGYYGSGKCEFEVGNKALEVIGRRELGFFPGICRGGAFKGFDYQSERGAKAVKLTVPKDAFQQDIPTRLTSYYNGGGVYVDAAVLKSKGVEVLASYTDEPEVPVDDGRAAVVFCQVGQGRAILSGPHPEFSHANLRPQPDIPGYASLVHQLRQTEGDRIMFLVACLEKLGLEPRPVVAEAPLLSALHLSSAANDGKLSALIRSLAEIMDSDGEETHIRGETDYFQIQTEESFEADVQRHPSLLSQDPRDEDNAGGAVDYATITKRIVTHEIEAPTVHLTPHFNHAVFYSNLARYQSKEAGVYEWGNLLLYGDVVTSTNSLLHKNANLASKLPQGFTFTATSQVAGRGRGTNVWIAPPGSLIFSTVIDCPVHTIAVRPIIFIQYVAAIAIVEAIRSYDAGYENIPVKVKWPNDIFAADPTNTEGGPSWVKIGGILSQCNYAGGSYQVVLGIGINAVNPRPTISLSDLVPPNAPALRVEKLLARVLTCLEKLHGQFRREGFSRDLEDRYYKHWLHTNQEVTLDEPAGTKARIKGITRDWGMLRVEEIDDRGDETGRRWQLQSDENSFDYWKGLLRKKL